VLRWSGGWLETDLVAVGFEFRDLAGFSFGIETASAVADAELAVGCAAGQNVADDHQHCVGNDDDRLPLAVGQR
jgi:hypothetical protein